jgi:ComF family protein
MCDACRELLVCIDAPIASRPGASARSGASRESDLAGTASITVYARFVYAEPVRHAIHLLKYQGERARSEWFADELQALVVPLLRDDLVIAPVPLAGRRERMRGFNQSAEIAQRLSTLTGANYAPFLKRVRDTQPQVELSGLERIHNVRGAFSATASLDRSTVIVVDDVVTTGATLRECARACLAAGAGSVIGIAAASGLTGASGSGS